MATSTAATSCSTRRWTTSPVSSPGGRKDTIGDYHVDFRTLVIGVCCTDAARAELADLTTSQLPPFTRNGQTVYYGWSATEQRRESAGCVRSEVQASVSGWGPLVQRPLNRALTGEGEVRLPNRRLVPRRAGLVPLAGPAAERQPGPEAILL